MLRIGKAIDACSVHTWRGFTNYSLRSCDEVKYGLTQEDYSVAWLLGNFLPQTIGTGWMGGGAEVIVGIECNSDNPNQHSGHAYSRHSGDLLQHIVGLFGGGLGVIYLSPWSSGKGDTGSQIRTVTWAMRPTREWRLLLESVMKEREAVVPSTRDDGLLATLFESYQQKVIEGERW